MQMDYDKLKVILESIDFKPINSFISESNPIEALKINFNPESRDENLEMIFTLFSPQDISALLREKTEFYFLNMTCFLPITFSMVYLSKKPSFWLIELMPLHYCLDFVWMIIANKFFIDILYL